MLFYECIYNKVRFILLGLFSRLVLFWNQRYSDEASGGAHVREHQALANLFPGGVKR